MYGLLARLMGSHKARTMVANYGKSAWSVAKRIGWRNARRWALLDDGATITDRMGDTVDTTAWIMGRIIKSDIAKRAATSDTAKRIANTAFAKTGRGDDIAQAWRSSSIRLRAETQHAKYAYKKNETVFNLKQEHFAKRDYKGLNLRTGELGGPFDIRDKGRDMARFARLAALSPTSRGQVFANQFVKGAGMQFAATQIFEYINSGGDFDEFLWSSQLVHNLDEIYMPAGRSQNAFQFVELGIQAFNMLTLLKTGGAYRPRYHRVNRLSLARNIYNASRLRSLDPLKEYGSLAGVSRLGGGIAYRQLALATGSNAQTDQEGQMVTIWIDAHSRKNGQQVKGHYRQVPAYTAADKERYANGQPRWA